MGWTSSRAFGALVAVGGRLLHFGSVAGTSVVYELKAKATAWINAGDLALATPRYSVQAIAYNNANDQLPEL